MIRNPIIDVFRVFRQFILWLISFESLDYIESPARSGKTGLFRLLFGRESLDVLPVEKSRKQFFLTWLLSREDLDHR